MTLANIPADPEMVACYGDGIYRNDDEARRRFPLARIVTITVFNGDFDVLDVEQGDATPEMAPGWITHRHLLGHIAVIYCNASTWAAVQAACSAAGVTPDGYWIAQYDHNATIPTEWINAGCVAKQYIGDEGGIDTSSVLNWPGSISQPVAAPVADTHCDDWLAI
ncbi:MAG: hypothetical protein NVSMB4_00480 [Acidimicrobiales bacterium]